MGFERPLPVTLSDKIRAMRANTDLVIDDATPETVKTVASRVGLAEGRKYRTARENGGVRVWRVK